MEEDIPSKLLQDQHTVHLKAVSETASEAAFKVVEASVAASGVIEVASTIVISAIEEGLAAGAALDSKEEVVSVDVEDTRVDLRHRMHHLDLVDEAASAVEAEDTRTGAMATEAEEQLVATTTLSAAAIEAMNPETEIETEIEIRTATAMVAVEAAADAKTTTAPKNGTTRTMETTTLGNGEGIEGPLPSNVFLCNVFISSRVGWWVTPVSCHCNKIPGLATFL